MVKLQLNVKRVQIPAFYGMADLQIGDKVRSIIKAKIEKRGKGFPIIYAYILDEVTTLTLTFSLLVVVTCSGVTLNVFFLL